jgi:hypothetical protein
MSSPEPVSRAHSAELDSRVKPKDDNYWIYLVNLAG